MGNNQLNGHILELWRIKSLRQPARTGTVSLLAVATLLIAGLVGCVQAGRPPSLGEMQSMCPADTFADFSGDQEQQARGSATSSVAPHSVGAAVETVSRGGYHWLCRQKCHDGTSPNVSETEENGKTTRSFRCDEDASRIAPPPPPPLEPMRPVPQDPSECVASSEAASGHVLSKMAPNGGEQSILVYSLRCPKLAGKLVEVRAAGTADVLAQYGEAAKDWPAWLTLELELPQRANCADGSEPLFSQEHFEPKAVAVCARGIVSAEGLAARLVLKRCKKGLNGATCEFRNDFRIAARALPGATLPM